MQKEIIRMTNPCWKCVGLKPISHFPLPGTDEKAHQGILYDVGDRQKGPQKD